MAKLTLVTFTVLVYIMTLNAFPTEISNDYGIYEISGNDVMVPLDDEYETAMEEEQEPILDEITMKNDPHSYNHYVRNLKKYIRKRNKYYSLVKKARALYQKHVATYRHVHKVAAQNFRVQATRDADAFTKLLVTFIHKVDAASLVLQKQQQKHGKLLYFYGKHVGYLSHLISYYRSHAKHYHYHGK